MRSSQIIASDDDLSGEVLKHSNQTEAKKPGDDKHAFNY